MRTTRADRAECTAGGATSYLVSYLCDKQCSPHFKPVFFPFSSLKHSHYSFSQVTWKLISSTCSVTFHLYPPLLALKMLLSRFNTAFPHTSLPYTVILWKKKKKKSVPSVVRLQWLSFTDLWIPSHSVADCKLLCRGVCLNDWNERWIHVSNDRVCSSKSA